jgi:hypothetical protein
MHLEASTKLHVHQKFEIFWTNIASTMACLNFKNGQKNGQGPLRLRKCDGKSNATILYPVHYKIVFIMLHPSPTSKDLSTRSSHSTHYEC